MEELLRKFAYLVLVSFTLISNNLFAAPHTQPQITLAKVYQKNERIDQYWVSEKLDGMRAYWDGKNLISRQGNPLHPPNWFIAHFPDQILDGELWIGRGTFEQLVSTVRKKHPIDSEWRKVRYMVFDLPGSRSTFTDRLLELDRLISEKNNPYIRLIKQYRLADHAQLMEKLDEVVMNGGEGLMLHRGDALYHPGRSNALLKVKKYQDAEAIVIAHLPGKGKYHNMLGSLLLEMPNGKKFRLGTGFKDRDRKDPPAIGSKITYKYFGLTRKGIPRFASFLRIRQ